MHESQHFEYNEQKPQPERNTDGTPDLLPISGGPQITAGSGHAESYGYDSASEPDGATNSLFFEGDGFAMTVTTRDGSPVTKVDDTSGVISPGDETLFFAKVDKIGLFLGGPTQEPPAPEKRHNPQAD